MSRTKRPAAVGPASSAAKRASPFELSAAATFLDVIGEPTRLAIVRILAHGEATVGTIATKLGTVMANASHHLQTMMHAGVLSSRKESRFVIYDLVIDFDLTENAVVLRKCGIEVRVPL